MMGVMNNLVVFDQHVAQNSTGDDQAGSSDKLVVGCAGTELTFKLRKGSNGTIGKPFTAADSNAAKL